MSIVDTPDRSPSCAARAMPPGRRIDLALASLGPLCCVSRLADGHDVSRKFVYAQRLKARDALAAAFDPPPAGDPGVLSRLDVTKTWLCRFVLAAVLVGRSSPRGCQEMLGDLLGHHVSLGWVHSAVADAASEAGALDAHDLARVRTVALDEIFQHGKPVLAAVDVGSTYCRASSREGRRDGDTWGARLLDLRDRGLAPEVAVADFAKGLRAGVRAAMPDLGEADADVWHPPRDFGEAAGFLEDRAYKAIAARDACLGPFAAPAEKTRTARREQDAAVALADDAATLLGWLRGDVLSVAGPPLARRREPFDMVVEGLRRREPWCEHRLRPVRSMLASGRDRLLAFAGRLDRDVAGVALWAKVSEEVVREMVAVQEMADGDRRKWPRDAALRARLGGRYHGLSGAVAEIRAGVARASSVVGNLNSRLRNYFFLRKGIGGGYLGLLRSFLNHRRFARSEHPERVGKSPAELLTGKPHPHWLEMLGHGTDQAA